MLPGFVLSYFFLDCIEHWMLTCAFDCSKPLTCLICTCIMLMVINFMSLKKYLCYDSAWETTNPLPSGQARAFLLGQSIVQLATVQYGWFFCFMWAIIHGPLPEPRYRTTKSVWYSNPRELDLMELMV